MANHDDDSRLPPPGFVMVRRGVTTDELREMFRDFREEIGQDLEKGQGETNRRLDEVNLHLRTLNGRVGKGEQDRARLDEAVKNLGREVFNRRRDDGRAHDATRDKADRETRAEEDKALTRRELHIVLATLSAGGAVVVFVWKVLPVVLKAVGP